MAIKTLEFDYPRKNTRWDEKKKKHVGYMVDIYVNKKRRREMFDQQKKAKEFLDAVRLEQTYKRNGLSYNFARAPRLSEVFQKQIDRTKTRHACAMAKRVFDYFSKIVGFDVVITDIRAVHFQKFVNARLADGVTAATVQREFVPIAVAFRTAPEVFPDQLEGYEPPKVTLPKSSKKPKQTVITESQKDAIIKHLMREKQDSETAGTYQNRLRTGRLFEIAWLLGLRLGEALKLKKIDFNNQEKSLRVIRWKTNAVTMMEFLPEVVCDAVQRAIDESETDYIYSLSGVVPSGFYTHLKETYESAGVRYGRKEIDGAVFHTNRHSFTTRLVQVADLATVASFTGHSNKEMVAYYSHASGASRRSAMQKLYGKERLTDEDLMEMFVKIRSNLMSFNDFKKAIFMN